MTRKSLLTIYYLSFITFYILLYSYLYAYAEIPDVVLNQRNTVVTIHVHDKDGKIVTSGGGFIVDQDGIIATNCNVIINWLKKLPNTLVAVNIEGLILPIDDLISSKCINNLALIKVKTQDKLSAVTIAKDYRPKKGNAIFAVGSPSKSDTYATDGIIKNVLRKNLMQISIPVLAEESGRPVFSRDGKAIAALTFLPKKSKKRHYAVPLDNLVKQLNQYKKRKYELVKKVSPGIPPPYKKSADARDFFLRGCSYYDLEMYNKAIKFYKKAIELKPDFTQAFVNLGVTYYKLGKYSNAIEIYKKAVRLNPQSTSIYNKLGSTYIIHGSYSKALDSFKKAIEIDPKNPTSHYNLGIAYYLSGERDDAFKEYTILKELDMDRAKSLLNLIY